MIKILLCGYNGAMGETILSSLPNGMEVVAGISANLDNRDFEVAKLFDDITVDFDIIVDFSHVSLVQNVLDFAVLKKKPLLIASTGITDDLHQEIDKASESVAIVQAGNYSLGIYAMTEAVKHLSAILDDFDLEVIEKHHRYKKDSPSGTAEMMVEALKSSRDDIYTVHGREGQSESKPLNEVGVHSIRAGSIVGEHSVIFSGEDEVLEIKHTASSKIIFATGAYKAIRYILNKDKGRYTLKDVVENA